MLNQIVIVGRIVKKVEMVDNKCEVVISVPRNYKNADGEYENDIVPISMFKQIAESVNKYCEKGDLVGIKGRVQTEDGKVMIVAEKVTFLSSKKTNEEE